MSKLLQIGIVGAVLYYLWDQQQKKPTNGLLPVGKKKTAEEVAQSVVGMGEAQAVKVIKDAGFNPLNVSKGGIIQAVMIPNRIKYTVNYGCPPNWPIELGCNPMPMVSRAWIGFSNYNSLIGLEGELL